MIMRLTVHPKTRVAPASRRCVSRLLGCTLRPAFTLVELMVVAAIIVLLVTLSVPAIGPMLKANQTAQAINMLNGLLTTAQTAAEANATPVAIRIERAFAVNGQGIMVDAQNRPTSNAAFSGPVWLDHQQARYVIYEATPPPNNATKEGFFEQMGGTTPVALPKGAWLAPDYAAVDDPSVFDPLDYTRPYLPTRGQDDQGKLFPQGVSFNVFETFYVVFDQTGAITRFPTNRLIYSDETQPDASSPTQYPYPDHPYPSARGLLVYDRNEFNGLTSDTDRFSYLQTSARPVYINRSLGSLVEGGRP